MNEPQPSTSRAANVNDLSLAENFHDAISLDDQEPDMCKEEERLKTFINWNVSFLDKRDLAKLGFYYFKAPDTVKCAFCGLNICRWKPKDDIFIEHFRLSQDCPLLHLRAGNNAPLNADELDSFILHASYPEETQSSTVIDDSCVYPLYKTKEQRLESYEKWPTIFPKTPQELSEAGFFYMGSDDEVACFFCGGSIVRWKEDDVVWEVHASRFSNCGFVKSVTGEKFIQDAEAKYNKSCKYEDSKPLPEVTEDAIVESKTVVPVTSNQENSVTDSRQVTERIQANSRQVQHQNTPSVHIECGTPLWNFKIHIGRD